MTSRPHSPLQAERVPKELSVTEESMFIVHRARVTELAARHKLPAAVSLPPACYRCRRPDGLHGKGLRSFIETRPRTSTGF